MVRAGYKQTEIGVIPEDWDVKSYDDVFTFLTTASNSRADLNENGDAYYIHYGDIHTKLHITITGEINDLPKIAKCKNKGAAYLKNGDLVMADASEDYAGIGKSIEVLFNTEAKIIAGLHTFLLRDTEGCYVDGFRGYLHSIPAVKKIFDRLATGLKVYGLSKSNLKLVSIPCPSPDEQKAIAKALTDVDGLIEALEKQIAKKRDIKTASMQQLLTGKKRLPGYGQGKAYKQTELGLIPEDWEVNTISNYLSITTGGKNTQDKITDGQYPFYVRSQTIERINTCSFDGEGILTAGDGVGTGKIFHYVNGKIDYHQRVYLMPNFSDELNAQYFFIFFSNHFYARIMSMTAKSSVDSVRREMIANMPIILPNPKEQKAIATLFFNMDNELGCGLNCTTA